MKQLENRAETFGMVGTLLVDNWTTLTMDLSALSIEKKADKEIWIDEELEYTIIVKNIDPANPVDEVSVTDVIDPTIARLIAGSVFLDGTQLTETTDYTYDADGKLTILATRIGSIPVGEKIEVTFRVEFVQP